MNELEKLRKQNEIMFEGLRKLALQPRVLSYGELAGEALGIDNERRRTVLIVRKILKGMVDV